MRGQGIKFAGCSKKWLGTKITLFHISVVIRVGVAEKQKIASYKLGNGNKFTPYTTQDVNCDSSSSRPHSATVPSIIQCFPPMKMSKIAISPFWLCISSAKSTESFAGRHNESNSAHSAIRTKFRQAISREQRVLSSDDRHLSGAIGPFVKTPSAATSASLQFAFSWGCFRTSDTHIWLTMELHMAYCVCFSCSAIFSRYRTIHL